LPDTLTAMRTAALACFVVAFVADVVGLALIVSEARKARRVLGEWLALNPEGQENGSYAQASGMVPVVRTALGNQSRRGVAVAALSLGIVTGTAGNLLALAAS
jgi:hypothetical protein